MRAARRFAIGNGSVRHRQRERSPSATGVLAIDNGSVRHVTYRRILLTVAITGSACWIGWFVWHYATTCTLMRMGGSHAITCRWETVDASGPAVASRTAPAMMVLWDMAARTFGIPAGAIIAGFAAYWLIERLRRLAR